MKLLFEYKYIKKGNWYNCHVVPLGGTDDENKRFMFYLCGAISVVAYSTEKCDVLLTEIDQVERGEETEIITGVDEVDLIINQSGVQVNITVKDAWCNQPESKFTFQQWKVALTGWKRLLTMPKSEDSFFEMDLSDPVEMPEPKNAEKYVQQRPKYNTMFPEHWDERRIKKEVKSAWNTRTYDGKKWRGISKSGVMISGYDSTKIVAFPEYKKP